MSTNQPKVVFFRSADRKWRWSLVASNGRKLCTPGESFSSKAKAEQNYEKSALILMRFATIAREYKS